MGHFPVPPLHETSTKVKVYIWKNRMKTCNCEYQSPGNPVCEGGFCAFWSKGPNHCNERVWSAISAHSHLNFIPHNVVQIEKPSKASIPLHVAFKCQNCRGEYVWSMRTNVTAVIHAVLELRVRNQAANVRLPSHHDLDCLQEYCEINNAIFLVSNNWYCRDYLRIIVDNRK